MAERLSVARAHGPVASNSWDHANGGQSKASPKLIAVLTKSAAILDLLSQTRDGLGISELARLTTFSKGNVHHILKTLLHTGLVTVEPVRRRYALGAKAILWGDAFLQEFEIRELAYPYLTRIREITAETASLYVRVDMQRVCVRQLISRPVVKGVPELGRLRPLWHGTSGLIFLSALPELQVRRYLKETPRPRFTAATPVTERDILHRLAFIRLNGYSINIDETELGLSGVGLPIFNYAGKIIAVISVNGPTLRWTRQAIQRYVPQVRAVCEELCSRLGARGHSV